MKPCPVPLAPGETIVLSGGRSWHAWLFTIAVLPTACMLLPIFLLPWALSGRYWLTQRRLIFQTPLGKPQVMALQDLRQVDVVGRRATLSLRHAGGSITMRFVENFASLWGAIVLLTELPVPEAVGAPVVQFRAAPMSLTFPGGYQVGYGVAFNQQLVFFPNDRPRNTLAEAGKLAGQLALALVGVGVARYQARLPFDLWLSLWTHLPVSEFEALMKQAATQRGGTIIPVSQLTIDSPTQYRAGEHKLRAGQPLLS
jgi:hypothetical protein